MTRPISHNTEADIAWMLDLGHSVSEVAHVCGVSASTIYGRLHDSEGSLDFCPWVERQACVFRDGWDEQTERDRRAQQPDRPEIMEVYDPRGGDNIMVSSESHISRHYRKDSEERTSR